MDPKLLDILDCPRCAKGDGLKAEGAGLACAGCGATYPIVDGVPRLLVGSESMPTRAAFTQQWRYRYQGAFERTNRVFWVDHDFSVTYLADKVMPDLGTGWFLDAGCGSGEKAAAMARHFPDMQVVAMDFSDTIGELAARVGAPPNLHAVQGDVTRPPFKPGAFNNVTSIGVLHHTSDTLTAFKGVAPLVKPGGRLGIWIYPAFNESPMFNKIYYVVRDVVFLGQGHKLPPAVRLTLLRLFCLPLLLLAPVFLLSKSLNPAFYQELTLMDLYRGLVFSQYDNLAPMYQFRHTKAEVGSWYEAHGFDEFRSPEFGFYSGQRMISGSVTSRP